MQVNIANNVLEVLTGDITKQKTEAIVNAANGTLMGGGGVDGAIHRAAGKELLEACKRVRERELAGKQLQTGQAVITKGYRLPADWVIHTVGPVWGGDEEERKKQLADCYRNSLKLAKEKGIKSISFPSISTGVYRFPVALAAQVAMQTIVEFLQEHQFGHVVMTLFSDADYAAYVKALEKQVDFSQFEK
ncbi:MAG TPA: O-acetyl-ADP-ribose deacetylase [Bacillota bacterium]|nr:O-acetyl-ADP-ribose deacetylase [Bacillota bacterium]